MAGISSENRRRIRISQIFRDANSNIVREVRWLTENVSQTVSVTIDASLKTFDSAYGELQAVESVVGVRTGLSRGAQAERNAHRC